MNIEIQFKKIKKVIGKLPVTNIEFYTKNILFVTVIILNFEYIYILRVKEDGELEYIFSPKKSSFSGQLKEDILASLKAFIPK